MSALTTIFLPASWTTTSPSATSISARCVVCCSRSKPRSVSAADSAVLEELFRSFHSIKGISGMVELREAEMLAHQHGELSPCPAAAERGRGPRRCRCPDPRRQRARADDRCASRQRAGTGSSTRQSPHGGRRLRRLPLPNACRRRLVKNGPGPPSWRFTFVPSPELLARGVNVDQVRARLRAIGTIVDAIPPRHRPRASRSSSSSPAISTPRRCRRCWPTASAPSGSRLWWRPSRPRRQPAAAHRKPPAATSQPRSVP